jgi:WD40 repeat protein
VSVPSGGERYRLSLDGEVTSVAFSPDGRVRFLSTQTSEDELSNLVFDADISSPRFTRDGSRILNGGWYEPLEIWDVRGRRLVATLSGPGGGDSVWFDRSRRRAATSGMLDSQLRLWDATSGKELHNFHSGCCLSASGRRDLRRSGDRIEIRDVDQDRIVSRITSEGAISEYRLSPTDTRLAIKKALEVELWDVEKERLVARRAHPYIFARMVKRRSPMRQHSFRFGHTNSVLMASCSQRLRSTAGSIFGTHCLVNAF